MTELTTDQYLTVPKKSSRAEIKVKGSRFIAQIQFAANRKQAEHFYSEIKKEFYDATHNCLAYRISEKDFRYSDDGEPSGTAGLPMFKILEGTNLYYTAAVVTRYFGSTKLGTGGLVRAYSDALKEVISKTKLLVETRYTTIKTEIKYEQYNQFLHLLNQFSGRLDDSDFSEIVKLQLSIPRSKFNQFQSEFEKMIFK